MKKVHEAVFVTAIFHFKITATFSNSVVDWKKWLLGENHPIICLSERFSGTLQLNPRPGRTLLITRHGRGAGSMRPPLFFFFAMLAELLVGSC